MNNASTRDLRCPGAHGLPYASTVQVAAPTPADVPGTAAYDLAAVAGLPPLPVAEHDVAVDWDRLPDCSAIFGCGNGLDFLPDLLSSASETTLTPATVWAKGVRR